MDYLIGICLVGSSIALYYGLYFNPHWHHPTKAVAFGAMGCVGVFMFSVFASQQDNLMMLLFGGMTLMGGYVAVMSVKRTLKFRSICERYPDLTWEEKMAIVYNYETKIWKE